ncbi:MAG: hypothetical protein U0325_02270 [Polyangiales bacterium]
MSAGASPFRHDGRVERRVSCAPPDVAMQVIQRGATPGRVLLAHLVALALGAGVSAVTLPGATVAGATGALLLLLGATLLRHGLRRRATLTDDQRAALPTQCALTPDALILEGARGATAWRYESVREIAAYGPWLRIGLHGGLWLVLRADEPGDEPLAPLLRRRATSLSTRVAARRVLALTLAYAVIVGLAALTAPRSTRAAAATLGGR